MNRNPVPYRPMVGMPNGSGGEILWALNPYLSEVVRVTGGAAGAGFVERFRTLPGPVSIARYEPTTGVQRLLVVCQHANALAVHDPVTGDMLDVYPMRAQPADIVVDSFKHAWVSCAGADVVVETDLTAATLTQRIYPIHSESPGFLSLYDDPQTAPNDEHVLVAPRVSGNGTTVDRKPDLVIETPVNEPTNEFNNFAGPRGIRNTLDTAVCVPGGGLPDQDLFWLDRGTGSGPGTARAIAKTTGTLLFAQAVRPGTRTVWQLNLDANNKNPLAQSEIGVRGIIVENRLTLVSLPTPLDASVQPVVSHTFKSLDDINPTTPGIQLANPNVPAQLAKSVGTPYSLAFDTERNKCYVAGLMTDNVVGLDLATGDRLPGPALPLPAGTMPRHLLIDATGDMMAIWGANLTVHFFNLDTLALTNTSLGFDPTPQSIQDGRKVFFDASHSRHNNASCASCHDEGKTDMLAWNLSRVHNTANDGADNKGPMVTQTLVGIDRAMPFHWRGEQQNGLADFNEAFFALLGGTELNATDFAKFEEYVLSLTEDANQFQHRRRVVDGDIRPPGMTTGDAVAGQARFRQTAGGACVNCHQMPTGSTNEVVDNVFEAENKPKRLWLKVAPFQGMQYKGMQPNVTVTYQPGQADPLVQVLPLMGTGLAHAGTTTDLRPFVNQMLQGPGNQVDRDNVVCFVFQFDTGTAPAAHAFVHMKSTNSAAAQASVNGYLLAEAAPTIQKRNCDVAVIGREAGVGQPIRGWAYDRVAGNFQGEDGSTRTVSYFKDQADLGGWFAFVGLPGGTARKFAIDFDLDEMLNGDETAASMFDPDADGDDVWDGMEDRTGGTPFAFGYFPPAGSEDDDPPVIVAPTGTLGVQWITQRTARLTFETNELTIARLVLSPINFAGAPDITLEEMTPKFHHNFLVNTLIGDLDYTATLTIKDLSDPFPPGVTFGAYDSNVLTPTVSNFVTARTSQQGMRIIQDLAMSGSFSGVTGRYTLTATGRVTNRAGNGLADQWVVARPLITRAPLTEGIVNGAPATAIEYPASVNNPATRFEVWRGVGSPAVQVESKLYQPSTDFPDAVAEPFAIATSLSSTDPNPDLQGSFTIQFTLETLVVGDVVTLAIEAVGPEGTPETSLAAISLGGNTPQPRFSPVAMPSFWSLPDTSAANREVNWTVTN